MCTVQINVYDDNVSKIMAFSFDCQKWNRAFLVKCKSHDKEYYSRLLFSFIIFTLVNVGKVRNLSINFIFSFVTLLAPCLVSEKKNGKEKYIKNLPSILNFLLDTKWKYLINSILSFSEFNHEINPYNGHYVLCGSVLHKLAYLVFFMVINFRTCNPGAFFSRFKHPKHGGQWSDIKRKSAAHQSYHN